MKKYLTLLLVLIMTCSVLSVACAEETTKISFGMFVTDNLSAQMWDDIVTAFEAANPDIDVELVEAIGDDRTTFWKSMLSGGNFPDVVFGADKLASMGIYEAVPADILELFDPGVLDSYDGVVCTTPIYLQDSMQVYYNKAMFEAAGIAEPEDYEGFVACCQTLKDAGYVPLICGGSGDIWATGEPWFMTVMGMELADAYSMNFNAALRKGEATFYNDISIASLKAWQELINAGYYYGGCMSLSYSQASAEFMNGAAAMIIDGPWMAAGLDAAGTEDFGIFAMPTPSGLKYQCPTTSCMDVYKDSQNKEAAFRFVKFFVTNADSYREFLQADGLTCATLEKVTYEQGPVMTKFAQNFDGFAAVPQAESAKGDDAWPDGMGTFINKSLQNIFTGADVASELAAWDDEYLLETEY